MNSAKLLWGCFVILFCPERGYRSKLFPGVCKMLVLTRKPGESITIGNEIKITVIEIKGKQVQLGIKAPSNIRIYREEIFIRVQEENRKAAGQKTIDPLKIVDVLNKGK